MTSSLEKQDESSFSASWGVKTWLHINLFKPTLKLSHLHEYTMQLEGNGHLNIAALMRTASMKWLYSFN